MIVVSILLFSKKNNTEFYLFNFYSYFGSARVSGKYPELSVRIF